MGLLTADTLSIAAGGKSFGALGEGNLKNSAGEEIPSTVTTYGSRLTKEDPKNVCEASFQIITVIPKSSESSKTFTASFGSYDWKYHFEEPKTSVELNTYMVDKSAFKGGQP